MSLVKQPLRIMLVDDNAQMRMILGTVLSGLVPTSLHHAADGAEAMDALGKVRPDIVLIDYLMSPIDGITFTRWVRTDRKSHHRELPIIMATGFSELRRVIEARDAGVTEILTKPVTVATLARRLSDVIYRPRPFVYSKQYSGPCRRRRDDPSYKDPKRREREQAFFAI